MDSVPLTIVHNINHKHWMKNMPWEMGSSEKVVSQGVDKSCG